MTKRKTKPQKLYWDEYQHGMDLLRKSFIKDFLEEFSIVRATERTDSLMDEMDRLAAARLFPEQYSEVKLITKKLVQHE